MSKPPLSFALSRRSSRAFASMHKIALTLLGLTLLTFPVAQSRGEPRASEARRLALEGIAAQATRTSIGHELFFDQALGADGHTACSSCHRPELAFTDGKQLARGVWQRVGRNNTPSLLDVGLRTSMGWEARVWSIEQQTERALLGWAELGADVPTVVKYVRQSEKYSTEFAKLLGSQPPTWFDLVSCLAAYERTLSSAQSSFDRYLRGNEWALTPSAREGLALFTGEAQCHLCHQLGSQPVRLTDDALHNTGTGGTTRVRRLGYGGDALPAPGSADTQLQGFYKTPSLRNVEKTAPYMHDGQFATLSDVIDFYDRGGAPNPFQDKRIRPLHLTRAQKVALESFLKSLTSER
jgi:cytochrome c peroxidase